MRTITLEAPVMRALAGHFDEVMRLIEQRFQVRLAARGNEVSVAEDNGNNRSDEPTENEGNATDGAQRVQQVVDLLEQIASLYEQGVALGREDLKTAVKLLEGQPGTRLADHFVDARLEMGGKKSVVAKSVNQRLYIEAMLQNDLVFGIGPAGTGKTYLAVAMAVSLLTQRRVRRIILARPAVEAGERLGFLPGDLAAKVDPYLRPLYDALYDLLEPDHTERLLEQGAIEIAPLAFMRGRTLDHSCMILDEAQNTTSEQMKMFLTRIGFHSKAVVTGDVTQIDLPSGKGSGLVEAERVMHDIPGIGFVHFDERDVVRHQLVQRIIVAYERQQRNGADAAAELPDSEEAS